MLTGSYIRRLEGDRECIEALAWLADHGFKYKSGGFTPPLTPKKVTSQGTSFCALSLRIGRARRSGAGSVITRADAFDGSSASSLEGSSEEIAKGIATRILCGANAGVLFVTSGKRRQALDVFLDSVGPELLRLGYAIQPCLSSGSVSWLTVRKGRHKWTVAYFETATGVPVSVGHGIAEAVRSCAGHSRMGADYIHCATDAVQAVYLREFGVALSPTVGMTAINAARVTLAPGFRRWRPDPLLVAMERDGKGYRGGLTYARRWRGPTVQVDITRQYTYTLARELPHEWAFGRFPGYQSLAPGVYMCRVRLGSRIPYPLGVWSGAECGFRLETVSAGEYVCVLHAPEIRSIIRAGGSVWPTYGYTATATFSFSDYADHIQSILAHSGRGSAIAQITKPLGNYVYGKLGQHPVRKELLFTESDMRPEWYPYFDEFGSEWSNLWERDTERYSPTQHVDVAGHITALARSQTVEAWLSLEDAGANVVRCHTDSLTADDLPESFRLTDGNELGAWRKEAQYRDTIIVGANAFVDGSGAHIAGIARPTYEMVERLYDDGMAQVSQRIRKPRRGFGRGSEDVTRELRATAH